MAREFDPLNRRRQLFFGVPESIAITPGRPAPPPDSEPSQRVKDKMAEMKPAIDVVKEIGRVVTYPEMIPPPEGTDGMPDLDEPEWLKHVATRLRTREQ